MMMMIGKKVGSPASLAMATPRVYVECGTYNSAATLMWCSGNRVTKDTETEGETEKLFEEGSAPTNALMNEPGRRFKRLISWINVDGR